MITIATSSRFEAARMQAQHALLLQLQALTKRIARLRGHKVKPAHLLVGERGEFESLFFLRRLGFTVVERRWRTREWNGDADLIAWEGDTLCFVEVKTRSQRTLTPAATAVDDTKRRTLRRLAAAYIRRLPEPSRQDLVLRFDVLSVYLAGREPQFELVRDAFPRRDDQSARFGV